MDLVSAIVPSYNRFQFLLNTIKSIKEQTYKNIEIIVVNDGSKQKEYYEYDWEGNNIKIIHLEKNSKQIFGYVCVSYVRNKGIEISNGKYIAFCDDDDIWFPLKIELQLNEMKVNGCKMSSTDGLIGKKIYNANKNYQKYNAEYYYKVILKKYKNNRSYLSNNGLPKIWDYQFILIHNCIICSSVLIEKEILDIIGYFSICPNGKEDYICWLKALKITNNIYLDQPLVYYDLNHGYGQNY